MSETRATYLVPSGEVPANLEAFAGHPCVLPYCHPDYRAPTPGEVSALIKLKGWSQRETSLIVGVSHTKKGSSTVRRWQTAADTPEFRAIPYAAWRILLEHAEIVTVDEALIAFELYAQRS